MWHGTEIRNEIRLVLIGKTGVGKSATGNTILGRDALKSEASGKSLTKRCSHEMAGRFGKEVLVVDTPGLFDTGMSNEQVTREIVKCIEISSPGPHAFVMVVSIGRFTKEEQDTVQHFGEIFGDEMYNHMIVLFTRRDDIERQNIDIHEYIQRKAPRQLQSLVHKCSGQVLAINNVQERDMRDKDAEQILNLVDEITRENGGRYYSNEMYKEAENQLTQSIQEIKRQKELEKEKEKMKIKEEIDFEYKNKISDVERQKREAERHEVEYREKVREIEHRIAMEELQDRNERLRIDREKERMNIELDDMERKVREAEEQEISLIRRMEIEREGKNKQRKEELEFEYQKNTEIIERQIQEAKRKERELQERELEQKRTIEEMQNRNERLRMKEEQEAMQRTHDEMKIRLQEAEEREAVIRREKKEKEERALKELEMKHQIGDDELRWDERKKIENEEGITFSKVVNAVITLVSFAAKVFSFFI